MADTEKKVNRVRFFLDPIDPKQNELSIDGLEIYDIVGLNITAVAGGRAQIQLTFRAQIGEKKGTPQP